MESGTPSHRAQPLFHRRGPWVLAWFVVILLVVAGIVLGGARAGWFGDDQVAVGPVPTAAIGLTADEQAYFDFMAPRLHELGAQARELARLGEERSRNIFDLQAHAGRLTTLEEEIDAFLAANATPTRFVAADERYREGVRLTNRAMDEAERAVLSADWERLGRVVAVFTAGAEDLEVAASLLDIAGGVATPWPDSGTPVITSSG